MLIEKGKMKRQRKSLIAKMLIVCLLLGTTPVAATEKQENEANQVNELTCQAQEVVGDKDMISSVNETSAYFVPETENFEVQIPKHGEESLILSSGHDSIKMTLPEETNIGEGVVSDEGYVVYTNENDMGVLVQTIEEDISSVEQRNSVRTMISIPNVDAPKEYSFDYNLPDGWSLIMGKDLGNSDIANDAVGIINEDGYAVAVIDSPWAIDAAGNALETTYRIDGSTLIQEIMFDQSTLFPILADPTTIVDTKTETKSQKVETPWAYCSQQEDGYSFASGGAVGWWKGTGSSKSIEVSSTLTTGYLTTTYKVGKITSATSGECVIINFPASTVRRKVQAKYTLKITEKSKSNLYRTTKITDNGKTTTVTEKWVVVDNWVSSVKITGSDYKLKKVT